MSCDDFLDVHPPFALKHLQDITGIKDGAHCSDFAEFCPNVKIEFRFLRFLCPSTCGCNSPRAGLIRDDYDDGCHRDFCHASLRYKSELAEIPCEDPSPAELLSMAGWTDGL